MFAPLFWFFSALTLIFGALVVVNRSPVACALSLVVSFMGLAALFVGLDAYLIGVLQVLVYAGAVMVLFLFIIMLLDLRAEQRRQLNLLGVIGGGLVALGFVAQLFFVLHHLTIGGEKFPPLTSGQVHSEESVIRRNDDLASATPRDLGGRPVAPLPTGLGTTPDFPALAAVSKVDDVKQIGEAIFSRYHLPLQVVGVLILVSTIGVVVLSKRELK